jgi:hydrogenase/urease accessory protein HupE
MNTETNKMHWVHWLYIVPFSFALSPIGTFIGVIGWKLNFVSTCILISVQFVGFLFLYAISNGGE